MTTRGHHGLIFSTGDAETLLPTALSGLTFWFDPNTSAMYQGGADNSSVATSNDDPVVRFDSIGSINRVISGGGGTLKTAYVAGKNAIYFPPVSAVKSCYQKPAASAAPSVVVPISTVFSASNFTILAAMKVNDSSGPSSVFNGPFCFGESSDYMGMYIAEVDGTISQKYVYNWDGNADTKYAQNNNGDWAVVEISHSSGTVRVRINDGVYVTAASGNTQVTTGTFQVNRLNNHGSLRFIDWHLGPFCTFNADNSADDKLKVMRGLGQQVGVVIP